MFSGDGTISPEELKFVLGACVTESNLTINDDQMKQLVAALLNAVDKDRDGLITFDEMSEQLLNFPGLIDNLTIRYNKKITSQWPHSIG